MISNVTGAGATLSAHDYTYDAAHRRTGATLADGSAWDYGYDDRDEVISAVKHTQGGETYAGLSFSYTYDDIGNRVSTVQGHPAGDLAKSFGANPLNQYTSLTQPGSLLVRGRAAEAATVTVNGQAATRQSGGYWHYRINQDNAAQGVYTAVNVNATLNGQTSTESGHLWLSPAALSPSYDADGNLTSDGRWNFTWNGENQLVAAEPTASALAAGAPKERLTFTYDAQGRRVRRSHQAWNTQTNAWAAPTESRYVYDGWNCVAVVDGTGALKEAYMWGTDLGGNAEESATGPDQSAGGVGGLLAAWLPSAEGSPTVTPVFYAYDGNGNVTGLVNAVNGQVAAQYDYTAFGEMAVKAGTGLQDVNPYRFSTKPLDKELGLYYYGFRYYDPNTGRWTSRDPMGEQGGENLYRFCSGNAISFVDDVGQRAIPSAPTIQPTPPPNTRPPLVAPQRPSGALLNGVNPFGAGFWTFFAIGTQTGAGWRSLIEEYRATVNPYRQPGPQSAPSPLANKLSQAKSLEELRNNCCSLGKSDPGWVLYSDLDSRGRAQGAVGVINKRHRKFGSPSDPAITPVGFYTLPVGKRHRGHIVADSLGGPGNDLRNISPMYSKFNLSVWPTVFENSARRAVDAGYTVCFAVILVYDPAYLGDVPVHFDYIWTVDKFSGPPVASTGQSGRVTQHKFYGQ